MQSEGEPSVRTAADALRRGELAVLTERHPDGTAGFVAAAAQTVTPEHVATMLRDAGGIPWLALPPERWRALQLAPVRRDDAASRNFLVTIEAREGTTTGVSAAERAHTMRVASSPESNAADVTTPGHVSPLGAHPPGAGMRPGIVEAAVELAALAAQPGGATLCQLLDEHGEQTRDGDVAAFARRHDLPLVDGLDVLDLLMPERRLVVRAGERALRLNGRTLRLVTYDDRFYGVRHAALAHGDGAEPVVRVHVQDPLADLLDEECRAGLLAAAEAIAAAAAGALVHLAPTDRPPGRTDLSEADARHEALLAERRQPYVVAQILGDLHHHLDLHRDAERQRGHADR